MEKIQIEVVEIKEDLSIEVDYDDALNTAGWVLLENIEKFQDVEPALFNNLKQCFKEAIQVYLREKV